MRRTTIAIAAISLMFFACSHTQVPTPEVNVAHVKEITLDPSSGVWTDVPLHVSKLLLQDLVDPRLMEPSTREVSVKAITDGKDVAFRLEWADDSQNDIPGPKHMIDGCAVQIPAKIEANAPAPQMGETGKTVEIAFWRADWQAIVEGRPDSITSIYPNATVDHYPSEAKPLEQNPEAQKKASSLYAPARSLGNYRAGPRDQPVEDLIAEGPGTLSPAPNAFSRGKGVRTSNGWSIVIARPSPSGFSGASPSQVAFAVWEGSNSEAGARKMRTGWVPMVLK